MTSILSVRNLKKVYPAKPPLTTVYDISFDLKAGEILDLLGPNDPGKTTTTIQRLLSTLGNSLEQHAGKGYPTGSYSPTSMGYQEIIDLGNRA